MVLSEDAGGHPGVADARRTMLAAILLSEVGNKKPPVRLELTRCRLHVIVYDYMSAALTT